MKVIKQHKFLLLRKKELAILEIANKSNFGQVVTITSLASAVLNTVRQTGGAIGVAAFGALATGGEAAILSAIPLIAAVAISLIVFTMILNFIYVRGNRID